MTEDRHMDSNELELRRRLRGLAGEHEPSHDLWPGIAQRLDPQKTTDQRQRGRRQPSRWRAWAALAASLLGLAVLGGFWPERVPGPGTLAPVAGATDDTRGARFLRIQAQAMTAEYQAALNEIGSEHLPMPMRAVAAELDRSAMQIREAMGRDPQSRFLLERLRDVYDRRLRLSQRDWTS